MEAWNLLLPTHLDYLQPTYDRVPQRALVKPNDAVRDGENWVTIGFVLEIFSNEERGGLVARQVKGEQLYEAVKVQVSGRRGRIVTHDRSEGVHEYEAGRHTLDFRRDAIQYFLQPTFDELLAEAGVSDNSYAEATKNAVAKASETLRNLDWFEVVNQRGVIKNGKVAEFQVVLKVGFRLESSKAAD